MRDNVKIDSSIFAENLKKTSKFKDDERVKSFIERVKTMSKILKKPIKKIKVWKIN